MLQDAQQPALALRVLPVPDASHSRFDRARVMLVAAAAHHQLDSHSEAQDWLQQAFCQIIAHGDLPGLQAKADALAAQF